ncbi:MAG: glycosyltransferase family 2 protein [Clostridiales bacterium]|jgi:glycosyltransferase involved in cell wall biosynthesis|nr:glycosyltransferase family 2 protein [Clostridiales bacterium]
MDKLYIVIPAYNEEYNIAAVVREWHSVTVKTGADSRLVVIDDGSKDNTLRILQELALELPQLIPLTKPNGGHGATILYGYRYALDQSADFVFQTDADGQTVPDEFWAFWEKRADFAAIIGWRKYREDGFSRVLVTKIVKLVLFFVFGIIVTDANTPFRLICSSTLKKHIARIPENFNLSNIMLSVCLVKFNENITFIPITFRPRQGGVNSINFVKICKIGVKAIKDFIRLRKELKA